jgi:hypothetical protein
MSGPVCPEEKTMHRAAYRFFDASFHLESDTAGFLAQFGEAYRRFRVDQLAGAPVYRVLLAGEPTLAMDNQTICASDRDALSQYALNAILNAATARVRSHFLFHAAALRSAAGQGVILAGGAGMGKTTLTLALLERGFGFLSDDVAAVRRSDGRLEPFPRRLGLRVPDGGPGHKHLLDVKEIAPSCPAHVLFVLADPTASQDRSDWYLVLDRLDEPLLAGIQAISVVRRARVVRGDPYPAVRLDLVPGAMPSAEGEIEAVCREHQALLFDVVQGRETPPDYSCEPCLTSLPVTDAARDLLHHVKGGPRSAMIRHEFSGSATRLYMALVDLAAAMDCYRVNVGRLNDMVEIIVTTAEQGPRKAE